MNKERYYKKVRKMKDFVDKAFEISKELCYAVHQDCGSCEIHNRPERFGGGCAWSTLLELQRTLNEKLEKQEWNGE